VASALLVSCSEDFMEPDPLSFYEPETTFSTESGLQAVLASADKQLRNNNIHYNAAGNSVPIGTEYVFSDMAKYGKTDNSSTISDFANTIVPTGSFKNSNK
jgi:hypothetical protein